MNDDPLSDALALAGATSIVSGALTATGRWAVRFHPRARLKVTAVLRGSCWMLVDEATEPIELTAGDVAVLNGRGSEVLATDLSAQPVDGKRHVLLVGADDNDVVAVMGDAGGHCTVAHIAETGDEGVDPRDSGG